VLRRFWPHLLAADLGIPGNVLIGVAGAVAAPGRAACSCSRLLSPRAAAAWAGWSWAGGPGGSRLYTLLDASPARCCSRTSARSSRSCGRAPRFLLLPSRVDSQFWLSAAHLLPLAAAGWLPVCSDRGRPAGPAGRQARWAPGVVAAWCCPQQHLILYSLCFVLAPPAFWFVKSERHRGAARALCRPLPGSSAYPCLCARFHLVCRAFLHKPLPG